MNKKKLNTILLLMAVVAIWTILIYKVLSALDPDDNNIKTEMSSKAFNTTPIVVERHTFDLYIPEKDPFLGMVINPKKPNISKTTTAKPPAKKNTLNLDSLWQNISYKGMISDKNVNKTLFLISIRSKDILLGLRQTHEGYRLVKGDSKTITLQFDNHKKTFKKQL